MRRSQVERPPYSQPDCRAGSRSLPRRCRNGRRRSGGSCRGESTDTARCRSRRCDRDPRRQRRRRRRGRGRGSRRRGRRGSGRRCGCRPACRPRGERTPIGDRCDRDAHPRHGTRRGGSCSFSPGVPRDEAVPSGRRRTDRSRYIPGGTRGSGGRARRTEGSGAPADRAGRGTASRGERRQDR